MVNEGDNCLWGDAAKGNRLLNSGGCYSKKNRGRGGEGSDSGGGEEGAL